VANKLSGSQRVNINEQCGLNFNSLFVDAGHDARRP
jgi:hypothetical protein